jgi:hypothetical protein
MSLKPIALVLTCLAIAAAALPASASASRNQAAIFQDDQQLLERGGAVQAQTLAELQGLGVDVIKVHVQWGHIAPRGTRKPQGFDATDPSQYGSSWGAIDSLVSNAQARGFQVMLALTGPAPGWATAKRGDTLGVDRPSGPDFEQFAEAVGRRYPSVHQWVLWNEPNHPRFLYPQARGRTPYAPALYRRLVSGGVGGLGRSGHAGDLILFGELLPIGKPRVFRKNALKPLRFLREFFCVNSRWRALRGRTARRHGCSGFRRVTGVSGFGYHPYTRPNGPRGKEPTRDDATIRSLRRVTRTLDRARRKRRLGGPSRMRIYNTEFGYQSNPPDPFQTRIRRIPGFLSESEWISYRNPRVASWSQYTLVDSDLLRSGSRFVRYSSWQGGLKFSNGSVKGGVYGAYRLPFFVRLLGPRAVEVWGDARPGGAGARIQVQQRPRGGRYANLGGQIVTTNARGYFVRRFRIPKASRRFYRFIYMSGGSTFTSRTASAVLR